MIKYIFCISPGRSGTTYLSKIFENCYNTISLHEPSPVCNDEPMYEFLKGNSNSMDIVAEEKYKDILNKQTNKKIYIETNHCFIKGFGWYLSNYLNCDEVGVIILNRDKTEVVKSLEKNVRSAVSVLSKKWLITPSKKEPIKRPPTIIFNPQFDYHIMKFCNRIQMFMYSNRIKLNIFQRILNKYTHMIFKWYYDEIYLMGNRFKNQHKDISFYAVDINDINNIQKVYKMLDYFKITPCESLKEIINKPVN